MKRILFLLALLVIVAGCTEKFSAIEYERPPSGGYQMTIDSTQWTSVLIRVEGEQLSIADNNGVRKVEVAELGETVRLVILLLLIAFMGGIFIGTNSRY
jgi:hypothetical protein